MAKFLLSLLFALFLSLTALPGFAAIDTYQFSDAQKQERFQKLTNELRCPKCQNQNIADSNAEIAADLRAKIHTMLEENKSDQDIINYMLERYGDFVLYQPRLSKQTILLWTLPAGLLLIGMFVIVLVVRFRRKAAQTQAEDSKLSDEQQKKLAQLLENQNKS